MVRTVDPVTPPQVVATPSTPAPWEQVVRLDDRHIVRAHVPAGGVLTLVFRADEQIVEAPLGDQGKLPAEEEKEPWFIKIGDQGTTHPMVHIRVTRPGLSVSLTVTTTKRVYVIDLKSVTASKIRLVRWEEPPPPPTPMPRLLPEPTVPASYHLGYRVCPGGQGCEDDVRPPSWRPTQVVDNGAKTFLFFPPTITFMTAPMVRLLGPTGPQVTNPRLIDAVLVLDHLIDRAELRLGAGPTADVVTVTRGPVRRIDCPGDPACPVWPTTRYAVR
jgi:type IV secretory pathway VirB9-like protein